MPSLIVDALGCCAAGLCAWSVMPQPAPQHVNADEVASAEDGDVGHRDQPVSPHGMHLEAHPDCDTCLSNKPKDDEEKAAEEDATSTIGSSNSGRPGDAGYADSEGTWTAAASPEAVLAPVTLSEHVEIGADAAAGHQAVVAEELYQLPAKQVEGTVSANLSATVQVDVASLRALFEKPREVCSSFRPQPEERLPCQEQPVACGSFRPGSYSSSSVSDQPGALATAKIAAAAAVASEAATTTAAAATEARDADAAAGQAAIARVALEENAEEAAMELAAAEAAAEEAAAELAAAQAAAAQDEPASARIVGRSGKFYSIQMGDADQQAGNCAPSQCLTRRFREFAALDMEVRPRHPTLPKLPKKSVFFRRTFKCGFMDQREQQLGAYVSALAANPAATAEPSVRRFLGLPC